MVALAAFGIDYFPREHFNADRTPKVAHKTRRRDPAQALPHPGRPRKQAPSGLRVLALRFLACRPSRWSTVNRQYGDLPIYGSAEFEALASDDPRSLASIVRAAEAWRLDGEPEAVRARLLSQREEVLEEADRLAVDRLRQLSYDLAGATDWTAHRGGVETSRPMGTAAYLRRADTPSGTAVDRRRPRPEQLARSQPAPAAVDVRPNQGGAVSREEHCDEAGARSPRSYSPSAGSASSAARPARRPRAVRTLRLAEGQPGREPAVGRHPPGHRRGLPGEVRPGAERDGARRRHDGAGGQGAEDPPVEADELTFECPCSVAAGLHRDPAGPDGA